MPNRRPESVAVLGIAGGNGLHNVDPTITKRVVGLDVNPSYLEAVRSRYAPKCDLELHCVDLAEQRVGLEPVQLVHAALVFEHAGGPVYVSRTRYPWWLLAAPCRWCCSCLRSAITTWAQAAFPRCRR